MLEQGDYIGFHKPENLYVKFSILNTYPNDNRYDIKLGNFTYTYTTLEEMELTQIEKDKNALS